MSVNDVECVDTICDDSNLDVTMNTVSEWNVIDEKQFKERICSVFKQVSDALSKTLGPYGSTTIIERYGEMYITKDGWQVLKSINFQDQIDNNIMMMLVRIATQVVLKVGDGSTSSIVAANNLLEEMTKDPVLASMRPKDFIDRLDACVGKISNAIYKNAMKVNTETFDEIYKLAYISTNGDDQISSIIQNIYKKTKNPSIEYLKAKDEVTRYEIVNGYKADIGYLDAIFATQDDGNAIIDNPYIITFKYKIDTGKALQLISKCVRYANDQGKRLVVVSSAYDKYLHDYISREVMMDVKANGFSHVIYTRASLVSNLSHDLYNDFTVMCGSTTLDEDYVNDLDVDHITDDMIDDILGEVEKLTVNAKTTLVEGFVRRNDNMYERITTDAYTKFSALEQENQNKSIVDTNLSGLKQRLSKLKGCMGIIHVGGYTSIEKGANFDLVEDAVRACESAYNYGFNSGGSLIVPFIINNELYTPDLDEYDVAIYDIIYKAFCDIFKRVIGNKYDKSSEVVDKDDILSKCLNGDEIKCYNLITDEYSNDIINSCVTDVEILKACVSIISLLISSNQYVSIKTVNY